MNATQFSNGTNTLDADAMSVTGVTNSCANGGICTAINNSVTFPVALTAGSAGKIYNSAASSGQGTFTVTPTFQVSVPQSSFKGTFTSTLTVAVVSGP